MTQILSLSEATSAIAARVHARRETYRTIVVNKFPPLEPLTVPMILGQYSRTEITGKRGERQRFIRRQDAICVDGLLETPTALSRDFLTVRKLRERRLPSDRVAINGGAQRIPFAPSFALPGEFDDGFYVDIRAAYFSIMTLMGWDVRYNPGKYIGPGAPLDFPFPDHKIARNSLVSIARPHTITKMLPPGGAAHIVSTNGHNPYLNFQLSALISDLLHVIASHALELGAIYANTDGYVAPDDATRRRIEQMIADFGLSARVKHRGSGRVLSVGAYEIGDFSTLNHTRGMAISARSNVVDIDCARWLQKNLEYWSARLGGNE